MIVVFSFPDSSARLKICSHSTLFRPYSLIGCCGKVSSTNTLGGTFTPYVQTVEQKMKCSHRALNARTLASACAGEKQIMSITTSNGRPEKNVSNDLSFRSPTRCFTLAGTVDDRLPRLNIVTSARRASRCLMMPTLI